MKWAEDAQRMKWAKEAQGTEWIGPAEMLGSQDQQKEKCIKLTWQVLQLVRPEVTTRKKYK